MSRSNSVSNYLTNCANQSTCEAGNRKRSREISRLFWNPTVYYRLVFEAFHSVNSCNFFFLFQLNAHNMSSSSSSSSSCSLSFRRFSCSLILKVELVPLSLLRPSHVPSSLRSVSQCLSWYSICVYPLYVL